MKLSIDNLQGQGPQDYTAAIDGTKSPRVERKINQPAELQFSLVANAPGFVVPVIGARVTLGKANGSDVFTGYVISTPKHEYLGWGEQGPVYRYNVEAQSDEVLLNQKALPNRSPFVARSAGDALRQLAQDLLPGQFDVTEIEDVDTLASYAVNPEKDFSFHAAEIALSCRGSFRTMGGALILQPVGAAIYQLNENDPNFSPQGLWLNSPNYLANEVMVIGQEEPQDYVQDYFAGDGVVRQFYLSQKPFAQNKQALIDEKFLGPLLDPTTWIVNDPSTAISVAAQTLVVSGGAGIDGQTTVSGGEKIEIGGALQMQHGDVSFTGASQGVLGGLYAGEVSVGGCLAGFQITSSGSGSAIQALINGTATGPITTTTAGHQYFFTTYLYSREIYRSGESYHSSQRPAGNAWGGAPVTANVRFVLEVQDIDPNNAASRVAPATVLYDDVIIGAPGFCTYALVNSVNMQCSIAYTYVAHISLAEVRTALPNGTGYDPFVTQLVGPLSTGASCEITSSPSLDFYPQYLPPLNQLIVVSYRGSGRAVAQIENSASVGLLQKGTDDGTRGNVLVAKSPQARTDIDCENAALAILDDATGPAWSGVYETWSDFLPGSAADIFPGDAIAVDVPSRGATFSAIVREVEIEIADVPDDRGFYSIGFANDLGAPLAVEYGAQGTPIALQNIPPLQQTKQVGAYYQANLTDAQITTVTSTTVGVDAGIAPGSGQGIEVRSNDFGWGQANDRNLVGRFNTQTFTLTRLPTVTQTYFLRLYDSSSPPKYSRYSAALHVNYPV